MKTCQNCGFEMPDSAKFCGKCKMPFAEIAPTPGQYPPPEQQQYAPPPPQRICQNCGAELPDNYKICGQCGTAYGVTPPPIATSPKRICQNCGTEVPDNYKICGKCGTPFTAASPPQPIYHQPIPPQSFYQEYAPLPIDPSQQQKKKGVPEVIKKLCWDYTLPGVIVNTIKPKKDEQ